MKIEKNHQLKDRKILVLATGSIAAIKTPILVSNLIKRGAEVRCVITPSASKLVSPLSLSTLSRNRSYQNEDQWDPRQTRPLHIELADWADFIVVAPLSASSLSRWINGLSEGLAASILLAAERPVIAAAAMNTGMWENEAIQNNWTKLNNFKNVIALSPGEGLLACDRIGDGRMASPHLIELAIESATIKCENNYLLPKDWKGIKLLVTAGATIEDLDCTRYISNRSSGLMGVLLGQAARFRGASVDFIHGQLQIEEDLLEGLNSFEIRSSHDMEAILEKLHSSADVIAMTAAVADARAKGNPNKMKFPKRYLLESLKDQLEIVPDLIEKLVKKREKKQIFLGFSALTGDDENIKKLAIAKKTSKGCDLLMANPVDKANQGFESDFNGGWLLGPEDRVQKISVNSKFSIAHNLLDELKSLLMVKSIKK